MLRSVSLCLFIAVAGGLAGCTSDYSPNTYASSAVQQANKVEPGIVVGFRQVAISANGTVGAVSGGAAGGILGAQVGTGGMNSALGTVGGTAIGGLLGTAMEHIAGDTNGWEYIVRKSNGELLSLTQKEPQPLPIGQKVLVITGSQARIVPDYSTPADPEAPKTEASKTEASKTGSDKTEPAKDPAAASQTDARKPDAAKSEPSPSDGPKSDIKAVPLAPPGEPASSASPAAPPPAALPAASPAPAEQSAAGAAQPSGGGPVRLTAPTDNAPVSAAPAAPVAPAAPTAPAPAESKPAD
ncbi:membrane protein [Azospirillum sp. B510]|uniref:outer membrane lipoprotein n=1 Tax=Azospirillum sp. (strain B510) TaxID=137722 RepID=UPI0002FAC92F|nr:membrane protein [Azospirillum sp. B510]